jgi:hypothetical protein
LVARCFFGNVSCLTSSARTGKYPVEVELDFFGVLIMDDVIRFDAITLASRDRADEFETFVKGTLFPVMMSAYGGHLTRKTLASLVGQVLLKEGAGEKRVCMGVRLVWATGSRQGQELPRCFHGGE